MYSLGKRFQIFILNSNMHKQTSSSDSDRNRLSTSSLCVPQQSVHNTSQNSANSLGGNNSTENIQVFLRMRPLNKREMDEDPGSHQAWRIIDNAITLEQSAVNQHCLNPTNSAKLFSYSSTAYTNFMSNSHSKAYSFSIYY